MPLYARKKLILARTETTYGVDPVPTASSHAILVRNLNIMPLEVDTAERDLIRPYFGQSDRVTAAARAMVEFECELMGSGTAGTVPQLGALLRACGFSETILAAAVTGTAQGGATNSITLAVAASSVDGAYNGMPVRITGGTGAGQSAIIQSYVGSTRVATVSPNWTTPPNATSVYSVDPNVVYRPVSQAFESATIYCNVDGVLHRLTGARGTFTVELNNKQIPVVKFTMTGLYNTPTDVALPVPTYSSVVPLAVNNINTTGLQLHGFGAQCSQLSLDIGNSVVHRTLIGGTEEVLMTDRKVSGQIVIEAPTIAQRDYFSPARNSVLGNLVVTHGTAAGNRVTVQSAQVELEKPTYTDMDGVQMLQMDLLLLPTTVGNNELNLIFT